MSGRIAGLFFSAVKGVRCSVDYLPVRKGGCVAVRGCDDIRCVEADRDFG